MIPLHKAPQGLLELFRLRALGRAPDKFGDTVTPVTDVSEEYGALNKLISGSAATVGAITGVGISDDLTLTGPVRLHYIGAIAIIGAAAATNVTLSVRLLDPSGTGGGHSEFFAALNAAARAFCVMTFPKPIVLPPGWIIRASISGTAAGVDHSIAPTSLIDIITQSPLLP